MEIRFLLETKLRVKIFAVDSVMDASSLALSLQHLSAFIFESPAWVDVTKIGLDYNMPVVMIGPKEDRESSVCDYFVPHCAISWPVVFSNCVRQAISRKTGPVKGAKRAKQLIYSTSGETVHQGLGAAS